MAGRGRALGRGRHPLGKGDDVTVPLVAPANTTPPEISGDTVEGSTLSCSTGSWTGNPAPTFTYQWRNATVDIAGETNSTYTTVSGDVGDAID